MLTILPYMEDLVQAAILDAPVANQLGVGGAQVDLLTGQFEEGGVLVWTDAVGAELKEGSLCLLGASGEVHTRLQRGGNRAEEELPEPEPGFPLDHRPTKLTLTSDL